MPFLDNDRPFAVRILAFRENLARFYDCDGRIHGQHSPIDIILVRATSGLHPVNLSRHNPVRDFAAVRSGTGDPVPRNSVVVAKDIAQQKVFVVNK